MFLLACGVYQVGFADWLSRPLFINVCVLLSPSPLLLLTSGFYGEQCLLWSKMIYIQNFPRHKSVGLLFFSWFDFFHFLLATDR